MEAPISWRFHGRAITSPSSPKAYAICDGCGFLYNHNRLNWQYQYAGRQLQNLRLLVCSRCLDVPQPQLKSRTLPPDPVPIQNPRPQNYDVEND